MQQGERTQDNQLVLSFYGDDFTGSTDAMESLTINGLPTVLFLDVPSQSMLERFPHVKCIGIAGDSRVMSPEQMQAELPDIFKRLKELRSHFVHYKVCSTFDSSKDIGNIATVVNISKDIFGELSWVPVLVAAPDLQRYTVFGNHFAAMNGETYRLDRHPTMSHHPITPMSEADLREVLKEQGAKETAGINLVELQQPLDALFQTLNVKLSKQPEVVLFDSASKADVEKVGLLLEKVREPKEPLFLIGSSGVGHAISAVAKDKQAMASQSPVKPTKRDRLLVVSGSCSPVTQKQLEWAMNHGFEGIHLTLEEVMAAKKDEQAKRQLVEKACQTIRDGKDLVMFTALGPDDPSIARNQQKMLENGLPISETSKILGSYLGELAKLVIQETGIERLVVAGGDTSSYATKELGIYALEMITSISPGAPLCRCYSDDDSIDGLELALKGGQFGQDDYFAEVKDI
ncbi:hypothetical protein GCM10011391_05700 [Pullulanibacillus camelliae]|uniref:Four-carbon acid sugar kinase family protein n=1 Tax=Pullulanibacillus camelliae TaxID=1707096 RepID=A0A8J2YEY9_9BACL|nr:four-carbon acid sugar kinase family protein [Pullulanibacillus camelliae]GGE30013.1 hypothetical protein GCM10011391_05700 [Pullulanibacillus camelliae]